MCSASASAKATARPRRSAFGAKVGAPRPWPASLVAAFSNPNRPPRSGLAALGSNGTARQRLWNKLMKYDFLIDTYDTERLKVLSVWSEFRDEDLTVRPKTDDP